MNFAIQRVAEQWMQELQPLEQRMMGEFAAAQRQMREVEAKYEDFARFVAKVRDEPVLNFNIKPGRSVLEIDHDTDQVISTKTAGSIT